MATSNFGESHQVGRIFPMQPRHQGGEVRGDQSLDLSGPKRFEGSFFLGRWSYILPTFWLVYMVN